MAVTQGPVWAGRAHIRGSTESMRMLLLTISLIGLQFAWGTEMTYATPYLLSLGLSKSKLSLVWVAGPLSGLIMQPVIGILADKSTSRWGRRRPFMVWGMALVSCLLLVLGWAGEIVSWLGIGAGDEEMRREATIVLAVVDIYVLDFAINVIQSTSRSLIVDTLPASKQQLGNAWASRLTGIGHLMIYGIGSLDLEAWLGDWLGDTQFKKVIMIATIALLTSTSITCWAVEERVLVSNGSESGGDDASLLSLAAQLYRTTRDIPSNIAAICHVVFWSWIGWFPFLFYGSTWVGEIYLRYEAPKTPSGAPHSDVLSEVGRIGSKALIVFSLVSFSASLVLPWFVQSPDDEEKPGFTPRPPRSLEGVLKGSPLTGKPSLLNTWTFANLMFAMSMIFAPFVKSVHFATLLVALCGIPWCITSWAPFALLGVEISKLGNSLPTARKRTSSTTEVDGEKPSSGSTGELAGVYLGILNLYTTLPQFVGTGISTIVFSILEPGKSKELAGDDGGGGGEVQVNDGYSGIGVCLFIGAICAFGAAWSTTKVRGAT